jgi:hypothetical protein
MSTKIVKIDRLREKVADSSKGRGSQLVGRNLREAGLLDRAVLNRQIAEILDGLSADAGLAPRMERMLATFLASMHEADKPRTAKHVSALLSLELDDLRKGALLSLMVRLTGKRKFDPVASYILRNKIVAS